MSNYVKACLRCAASEFAETESLDVDAGDRVVSLSPLEHEQLLRAQAFIAKALGKPHDLDDAALERFIQRDPADIEAEG